MGFTLRSRRGSDQLRGSRASAASPA
jgi:hypothetical protein